MLLFMWAMAGPFTDALDLAEPPELVIDETTEPHLFSAPCEPRRFDLEPVPETEACRGYIIPLDLRYTLQHKVEVELPHWRAEAERQHEAAVDFRDEAKKRKKRAKTATLRAVTTGVLIGGAALATGYVAGKLP